MRTGHDRTSVHASLAAPAALAGAVAVSLGVLALRDTLAPWPAAVILAAAFVGTVAIARYRRAQ